MGRCAVFVRSGAKEPSERPIITQYPIFDFLDVHIITLYEEIHMIFTRLKEIFTNPKENKPQFWILVVIGLCLMYALFAFLS